MSSIRDALRVVALEKHVEELQIQLDRLLQRQDELESAWREAGRPRGAPVDRGAQSLPTNDVRKAQGRY
jgi:hypothetical protein